MVVKPYALSGSSSLRQVREALDACLDEWGREWGIDCSAASVECCRAHEAAPGASWLDAMQDAKGKTRVWRSRVESPERLQRMMFPEIGGVSHALGEGRSIGAAVAEEAVEGLLTRCTTLFSLYAVGEESSGNVLDPWQFARASGAMLVSVKLAGSTLSLLLDRVATASLRKLPTATGTLRKVRWSEALKNVPVALTVTAGSAVATAASFAALEPGDVIRLSESADEPLQVKGPSGAKIFLGYLGLQGRSVAIEVAGS